MEEKTTETTNEGTVTITTLECRELIACQAMLDMILTSARRKTSAGYPDTAVVKMADSQRMLYLPHISISTKSGDEDAPGIDLLF